MRHISKGGEQQCRNFYLPFVVNLYNNKLGKWPSQRGLTGNQPHYKQGYMILGKKLIVIMPAYNAGKTLRKTYEELPHEYVDEVILVDDASRDETPRIAEDLGIKTIIHPANKGYGGNQK